MGEDNHLIKNKELVEEIKKDIIQRMEKYIDLKVDSKLKPVINYFKKKRDFFEMDFL